MIAIIDFKLGNQHSVLKAVKRIGHECIISSDPIELKSADKLILPGVGNFRQGIENIKNMGLFDLLNEIVLGKGKPILGICLGMQLMTKFSEEGEAEGFGWIDANTRKFTFTNGNLKIPHMGWNNMEFHKTSAIFQGIEENSLFYFVHSFYVECARQDDILTFTNYGVSFVSSFARGKIFGCQFHPEKSHDSGLKVLDNFCNIDL